MRSTQFHGLLKSQSEWKTSTYDKIDYPHIIDGALDIAHLEKAGLLPTKLFTQTSGKFFTRDEDGELPTGVDLRKVWSLDAQRHSLGGDHEGAVTRYANELSTKSHRRNPATKKGLVVKFIPTKDVTSFQIGSVDDVYGFEFTAEVTITGGSGADEVNFTRQITSAPRQTTIQNWTTINNVTLKAGVEYTLKDNQPEPWRYVNLKTGSAEKVFEVTTGDPTWTATLTKGIQQVHIELPAGLNRFNVAGAGGGGTGADTYAKAADGGNSSITAPGLRITAYGGRGGYGVQNIRPLASQTAVFTGVNGYAIKQGGAMGGALGSFNIQSDVGGSGYPGALGVATMSLPSGWVGTFTIGAGGAANNASTGGSGHAQNGEDGYIEVEYV